MAKFLVLEPNSPPETGYSPVEGTHTSVKAATDHARKVAYEQGDGGIALVQEDGTSNVWSVQYHPDRPRFEGLDAKNQAILTWETEYRVVEDHTTLEVEADEEGNILSERWSGEPVVTDEAPPVEEEEVKEETE